MKNIIFDFQICKNLGTSAHGLYKTMSDIFLIQSKGGFFEHGNLNYYNKKKRNAILFTKVVMNSYVRDNTFPC